MTTQKPTFRVMKNGYDRFAVDDAIERYAAQVQMLEKKLALYQESLVETTEKLEDMKAQYKDLNTSLDTRNETADHIARLSLREANEIIETAQRNADDIVREALATARLILTDLTRLYDNADNVKVEMRKKLETLLEELDDFQIPQMPDMKWLSEAEEKMR